MLPIYAGSFDPFTFGHASIAQSAFEVFGKLKIAIGVNPSKKGLFTIDERVDIIHDYTKDWGPNLSIVSFRGLLVDFCKAQMNPVVLVRGLRAVSDFEAEMAIADANRRLAPEFRTIFIPTEAERAFVSSSVVKEITFNTEDLTALEPYVTPYVAAKLMEKVWTGP